MLGEQISEIVKKHPKILDLKPIDPDSLPKGP